MSHHSHLTLSEREDIMMMLGSGRSVSGIARAIGRDKSTVSRELSRNARSTGRGRLRYRASEALKGYEGRRRACVRPRILDDPAIFEAVREKLLEEQWSPEQIEGRLALELGKSPVSGTTIYRAIGSGRFDGCLGGRKAACRLRHKGKRRRAPGAERRGKIVVSHDIGERPAEAESRSRVGDWESDTVAGVRDGACLVTNVDRKTGFLAGGKAARKASAEVNGVTVSSLAGKPLLSAAPDRGTEFAAHAKVTAELGVEFYFALPHHPWQRGTNENTNGLLRERFPKGKPLEGVADEEVQRVYDKLNRRPRKRLGYRTPHEAFFATTLQLI